MSAPQDKDPPAAMRPCAMCGKPVIAAFKPFCSKRCADVDLNRWLSGVYAIPGTDNEIETETGEDDERRGK